MRKLQRYDVQPVVCALADLLRQSFTSGTPGTPSGSGATFSAAVADGALTGISVLTPGSNYGAYARLVIEGDGEMASVATKLVDGAFSSVQVLSGGRGYASPPRVTAAPWLNMVYDNAPKLFSDAPPFVFFDYIGGTNEPLDEFEMTTRLYTINAVVCQALVQETALADQMTKAFVGVFYDLIFRNPTLGDMVHRCFVAGDTVQVAQLNGAGGPSKPSQFLANVFTVQIMEAQG